MLSPCNKNKRILYAYVWLGPSVSQPLNFSVHLNTSGLDPGFGAQPGAAGCQDSGTEAWSAVSVVYLLRCTLWWSVDPVTQSNSQDFKKYLSFWIGNCSDFFFKACVLTVWEDVAGAAAENLAVLVDQHDFPCIWMKQRNHSYFPQKTPPMSDMLPQVFQQNNKENNSFPLWSHRLSLRVLAWY